MFRPTCLVVVCLVTAAGCGAGSGSGATTDDGTDAATGQGSEGTVTSGTSAPPTTGDTGAGSGGATSSTGSGSGGGTGGPTEDDLEWDEVPPLDCGDQGHAVVDNGAGDNRVNFVVLGDGYTESELDTTYVEHVDRMLAEMFGEDLGLPYDLYWQYFNICRIDIVSNESGVDIPDEDVYVDTALDGWGSDDTRLGLVDVPKFNAALQAAMATANIAVDYAAVTLNTDRWFNSGGYPMIWSGGTSPIDVAVHEGGHTFHNLADEYGGDPAPYDGPEPGEINVTAEPTGMKWESWLGFDQETIGEIGAFEGGRYHDVGIWRPSANAKMNLVPERHSAPSVEKIIMDIYEIVRPIDDFSPKTAGALPPALGVRVVSPDRLQVDWHVDGALVIEDGGTILDTSTLDLPAGAHEIEARIHDPTEWVRHEDRSNLEQSVVWPVEVAAPVVGGGHLTTPAPAGARSPFRSVRRRGQPVATAPHPTTAQRRHVVAANRLLLQAQDALARGDRRRASELLARHQAEHGARHAKDRGALELALACAGDPAAARSAAARSFLAHSPAVRFHRDVRRECGWSPRDQPVIRAGR